MANNGTLNYNLTSGKPAYMLSEENYIKYIDERNKFDPTYPDSNDNRFDTPQYSYIVLETSLYRVEDSSGELTLVGSVYYPKTGNLVKFKSGQAIELKEPVTGNKVPLSSIKKLIPGIEYEFVPLPPDYSKKYLTFVVLEDGTFTFTPQNSNVISYSTDNGGTWTEGNSVTTNSGDKVMWKGTMTPAIYYGVGTFSATGNFNVEGNAMSLLYGDNFKGQTDLTGKDYVFRDLFNSNTKIISAKSLSLPATTLASNCYRYMFSGCTSLETAPELPAITLMQSCYNSMFSGCASLTTTPELPATTLAIDCYSNMFYGCTNLTTAPSVLPATTLALGCYSQMFHNCANLTTAPELPATTLTNNCYLYMFGGCTSLLIAPVLPASTLANMCYSNMFNGCTGLTTAPELSATTLAERCYYYMFRGCTSLTTAPELPATTLVSSCYEYMFYDCTNLNYIKALFTTTPGASYTKYWVSGVAATGTFVKNPDALWSVTGVDGIPTGWTVLGGASR